MKRDSDEQLTSQLTALDPADPQYATRFVESLLAASRARGASDVHLLPTPEGLDVRWRLDGLLEPLGLFSPGAGANIVARLKVLAELLTYRTDVPQEGRIRSADRGLEMRVSSFPTVYGEKIVVRIFSSGSQFLQLADLGLPPEIAHELGRLLAETSGAILVVGPAGSGKTTTLYACLRELAAAARGSRSLVSLEDPVEVALAGVAQSQVNVAAGFDLATGLRSILRQDPQVILVGEIRDRETAEIAIQASLTGQLVLSSFHAPSAAGAISRLSDMGIEPYALRSGLLAVVAQRLVRRLCQCALPIENPVDLLGLPVTAGWQAIGCPECGGTGYRGRVLLAEMLRLNNEALGRAILARSPTADLDGLAKLAGMVDRWRQAAAAVAAGTTSPAEIRRVLGWSDNPG